MGYDCQLWQFAANLTAQDCHGQKGVAADPVFLLTGLGMLSRKWLKADFLAYPATPGLSLFLTRKGLSENR